MEDGEIGNEIITEQADVGEDNETNGYEELFDTGSIEVEPEVLNASGGWTSYWGKSWKLVKKQELFAKFLEDTSEFRNKIKEALKILFPDIAAYFAKIRDALPENQQQYLLALFCTIALNVGTKEDPVFIIAYQDFDNLYGVCAVFPFGSKFSGEALNI
ncbi:hypothetical protein HK098_006945, partial [Nowakowskiella sp. JEL0407]